MNGFDPAGNDDQTPTFSITVIASTTDYTLPLFVNPNAFTNYYAAIGVAAAQAAMQQWYAQLAADRQQAHDAIVGQDLSLAEQALKKPDCAKHFGTAQTRSGAWDPTKVLSTVYSDKGGYIGGTGIYAGFEVWNYYPISGDANTGPAIFIGGNTGGVGAGYRVDINAEGWDATGAVAGVGAQYQAAGLLHELGHIFAFASGSGSGGSDIKYDGLPWQGDVSNANQDAILLDCFGIKN